MRSNLLGDRQQKAEKQKSRKAEKQKSRKPMAVSQCKDWFDCWCHDTRKYQEVMWWWEP